MHQLNNVVLGQQDAKVVQGQSETRIQKLEVGAAALGFGHRRANLNSVQRAGQANGRPHAMPRAHADKRYFAAPKLLKHFGFAELHVPVGGQLLQLLGRRHMGESGRSDRRRGRYQSNQAKSEQTKR